MFKSFRFIFKAIFNKKNELFISLILVLVLLMLASIAMYFLEHKAQPEAFKSIPATMWWGVATLTTVGYGDIYPITPYGKLLGGVIAILGVGLFALPAGIIASGFVEEIEEDKKAKRLKIEEAKLKRAFFIEYFVPVLNKKKALGLEHIPRKWLSMSDIKYKIGIPETTVMEVVKISPLFRLRNVKLGGTSKPGLEYIDKNRSYGKCINRHSNVTIVNLHSAIQPYFGHFSLVLSDLLQANYISNEVYSKLSFLEEQQLNLIENEAYFINENQHPALSEIKSDFKSIIKANSTCICIVNATSDDNLLQFNVGAEKGEATFDNALFFKNKTQLETIFQSAKQMAAQYDMQVLKHEKFGKPKPHHVAWYIHKETNCNLILLHVNVGFLKKKVQDYYQMTYDIAESIKVLSQ